MRTLLIVLCLTGCSSPNALQKSGDGCSRDSDCKGNRICVALQCITPEEADPGAFKIAAPDLAVEADLSSPPDLGSSPDLAVGTDLATAVDFAILPDLQTLQDLTVLPDMPSPPDLTTPPDLSPASLCSPACLPGDTCSTARTCLASACSNGGLMGGYSPPNPGTTVTTAQTVHSGTALDILDGSLCTLWTWKSSGGTLDLLFTTAQSFSAVQIHAAASPTTSETYTLWGFSGGVWAQIGQAARLVELSSILAPIPVDSGSYSGLRIVITNSNSWVSIGEVTLIP